ncbi:MAG TPA: extracellular solute-binding protein [Chloroflexota bacterium]|nr:extracellular solute-binding protein [Chloroflexota bacterium]
MTQRMISRRFMMQASAASALPIVLAACGAGGETTAAPKLDLKGVSIEHWIQNALTHPEGMAKEKVMQNFTAQSGTGVTVTSSGGQDIAKVTAALTAGTPPDLVDGFHFNMSALFRQGATVDIDAELKGDAEWKKLRPGLYPEIATGFTWKGKLFAVPLYSSFFSMYYQPEFLKRAGLTAPPPKTWNWDQFLDYGRKAARPPDVTAYDDQFSYSRTGMMVLNNNHRFLSQDGTKFSYNSPEAIEAVEMQMNMVRQGLMRAHDGTASGGYSEKMAEGKVVFQFAVAARVQTYRQQGAQFATTVFPLGPKNTAKKNFTHGESYGFAVFKKSDAKKQAAALQAAVWGARADSGAVFAKTGGTPPAYKQAVESADIQALKSDAEIWPFYELLPSYIPMPNFPGFAEVRSMGDTMIREIWAQKVTVRDGLNEYTKQAQMKLDEVLK